jgi:O-antigen ligase
VGRRGDDTTATVAPARPAPVPEPPPVTRPRGRLAFLLPLPVAAAAGVAAGWSPATALPVAAAAVSALVLVPRVEWAALALVGTAVFQDYLALVSPLATDWLAAVLVVAWLIRRAQGPLHEHRLLTALVPAGVFAAAVLVATAAHPNGHTGLVTAGRYAGLLVVLLVLADCLSGPVDPRRAARVYVASCVLASLCGIVTAALDDRHRVAGPAASSDTMAFFLVAALALVAVVGSGPGNPAWWGRPGPGWATFAILLVAVVGTQSRSAMVALALMLVVAVSTGLLALRNAGVLLAVLATGAAFVLAVLPHPIGQALTDPQRYADTNIAQRNDLRQAAFEMTRASPVVGLGPGAFALFHQDYWDPEADSANLGLDVAYSTFLEASAELGVPGALALYAVWLVPAIRARRRWVPDRSRTTAATLLALDGLATMSLIETEQYVLPLWFLAAMAVAVGHSPRSRVPLFPGNSSGQVVPRS